MGSLSMAWAIACRTFNLDSAGCLLLVDKMVSPSVVPKVTAKFGSAFKGPRLCAAREKGIRSRSPDIMAAICAAWSLMKRNLTFCNLTDDASR